MSYRQVGSSSTLTQDLGGLEGALARCASGPEMPTPGILLDITHPCYSQCSSTTDANDNESTFHKLDTYLNNLVATTTSDHSILQQLLENNATLTENVAAFIASLASLILACTLLAAPKRPHPTTSHVPHHPTHLTRINTTGHMGTRSRLDTPVQSAPNEHMGKK